MKEKSVNVECSFCGKQIQCPENKLSSEKYSCFECFEVRIPNLSRSDVEKMYVDIKIEHITDEILIQMLIEDAFPELWRYAKGKINEMSHKELSINMFIAGARAMLDLNNQMNKEIEELKKVAKSNRSLGSRQPSLRA